MERNALMSSNPNSPQAEALAQLRAAWDAANQDKNAAVDWQGFLRDVRSILETSRITREWSDRDLPKYRSSAYEERGDLRLIRPWRTNFFRLTLGGILKGSILRGWVPFGRQFWLVTFPNLWCKMAPGDAHVVPPPMAPSRVLPATDAFASTSDYRHWVSDQMRRRISKLGAARLADLTGKPYDPERLESFSGYAQAISAASVILMADKLGLGEEFVGSDADSLRLEWLDRAVNEPFQFRYRGDSQLWPPDQKRVYVDLNLRPILGQVLTYLEGDWNKPWVTRSLSLWEASTRTVGDSVVHTRLRRIDLELAVWCEAMLRLIPEGGPSQETIVASTTRPEVAGTGIWNGLPQRMRELANRIHEATRTMTETGTASATRFLDQDSLHLAESPSATQSAASSLTIGVTLIPPSVARPELDLESLIFQGEMKSDGAIGYFSDHSYRTMVVKGNQLRGDILNLTLEWEQIAQDISWMEIKLLVLERKGGQDTCASIDFEQLPEGPDAHLRLLLQGKTWKRLRRAHARKPSTLIGLFSKTWFGYRMSGLGTGAVVVGLVDLTKAE